MPEGDTVWLTARRLHHALAGRAVTRFDLRVPALALADLRGDTLREVAARGKHIIMRFDGGTTLHTHLRMDGAWHLCAAGSAPRGGPHHAIRAVVGNPDWLAVGYRVHDIQLGPRAEEDRLVGHLGPDLLGPDWDVGEAVRRLLRDPQRPVGEALVDQTNLAVSATCTRPRHFSCGGSIRGCPSARSRNWPSWPTPRADCYGPIVSTPSSPPRV